MPRTLICDLCRTRSTFSRVNRSSVGCELTLYMVDRVLPVRHVVDNKTTSRGGLRLCSLDYAQETALPFQLRHQKGKVAQIFRFRLNTEIRCFARRNCPDKLQRALSKHERSCDRSANSIATSCKVQFPVNWQEFDHSLHALRPPAAPRRWSDVLRPPAAVPSSSHAAFERSAQFAGKPDSFKTGK